MFVQHDNPTELAKEIFWLAWQSSSVFGMGWFQDNANATKEDVWNNTINEGDYFCKIPKNNHVLSADYVFGRMMKLRIKIEIDGVQILNTELSRDYQSWCVAYPTIQSLVDAALKNLE